VSSPHYARRAADPEVVAVVGAWLAQRTPADLEHMAAEGADMVDALRRDLGFLAVVGPTAIRAALGPERVREFGTYTDADFQVLLDDLLVSRPDHAAILAAYEDWYLDQVRRLRDLIVHG
jgi:hypothetical protein